MFSANSVYLNQVFNPTNYKKIIRKACKELTPFKDKFNCVAFRGMSGALLGPHIANRLGKYMIIARKTTDRSHSCLSLEGVSVYESIKYIIVDDFIYTGNTISKIQKEIGKVYHDAEMVGVYLYLLRTVNQSVYKKYGLDKLLINCISEDDN